MSETALAAPLPQPVYVTIIGGPDRGVAFKLLSQKVTLGRDDDNDIALNDPRCSRHHAVLEAANGMVSIKDCGSQNGLIVNGANCRDAILNPGDVFILGDTQFQIQTSLGAVPAAPAPRAQIGNPNPFPKTVQAEPESKPFPIVMLGVVLVLLILLVLKGGTKKAVNSGIRTDQLVQAEIEATQRRKEEISRLKRSEGQFSQQYMEAQAAYIQGFRDYREGNFGRAIQSFTAALALYPAHELALRYKKLSERKLDETVQYRMFEARRYMEQNKYEMAKSAYKNIMVMVNDPNNKTYLEAKERYEEIELLLSGKF
ncbi:MAG: FHA domain-containing protein [Bdellovibrionia bacterium]